MYREVGGRARERSLGREQMRRVWAGLAVIALFCSLGAAGAQAAQPPHSPRPTLDQTGFGDPCGTATDSHGDLYVADGNANKIKIFGPGGGTAITEFTAANAENPCSIAVDSTGNVYVDGWVPKSSSTSPIRLPA